jgi:2,4-dienoyl-CoA reductase-like NADH-dependent reductase (Old Yellow Enzyme family)
MEANDAAAGGAISERALERYLRLAEGQWGVVSIESTYVSATSRERFSALRLTEATLPSFADLARRFKARNPEALLLVQLSHSGGKDQAEGGPTAPLPEQCEGVDHLSGQEIEQIRQQFVAAALLAYQAGLDGIDLKLCHGYLGAKLLRPANTRTDGWGGAFEDRTRFFVAAIRDIRARLPAGDAAFLLGTRISFYERLPGGCGTAGPKSDAYDPTETYALIRLLDELGLDFVNVSGDATETPGDKRAGEERAGILQYERLTRAYLGELEADRPREIPMAVMGSGYSALGEQMLPVAARRLAAGYTDLIGLGRQSFADPLTPLKLSEGRPVNHCLGCWACNRRIKSGHPAACVVYT